MRIERMSPPSAYSMTITAKVLLVWPNARYRRLTDLDVVLSNLMKVYEMFLEIQK